MILKFYVKYQTLYLLSRDPVVADSSGYLQANFIFSDDWEGTNKTAQFKRTESNLITDGNPLFFNEEIDSNGNCIIPWEVLKGEGTFNVNVYGQKTDSDGTTVKTITVDGIDVRVGKSGLTTDELPQDSTASQYDNIYEKILATEKETQTLQTEAAASQAAAKTSETNAASSATSAAASAEASATSATAAASSATNAANSATLASNENDTAKAWATFTKSPDGATDTDSSTGKTQSSKTWALYSKDRATASASSASAASTSANNAKASETNAANSKTAAANSASGAATSASAASGSATAAANSAKAAATSEGNAKTSETHAASSASASAKSASAAKGSEDKAKTSEVNAKASEVAAAESAKQAAAGQINADWNETDADSKAFIKNKPDVVLKSDLASSVSTSSLTVTGETSVPTAHVGNATSTIASTAFVSKSLDQVEEAVAALYVPKAELASSVSTTSLTVTGETSVPTANEGNSSNTIASTEFVAKSLAKLVDSAPETMNTLNELAKALGNDPNFATTIVNELAKKLNSAEAESTYVKQGGMNLWNALHNNTTSNLNGLTNAQWNSLGFFIRYFPGTTAFENQPSIYGQLINISADKSMEATQLFIEQNSGKLYFRGGNGSTVMKDVKFKEVAYWNDNKHLVFPNGAEMWVS